MVGHDIGLEYALALGSRVDNLDSVIDYPESVTDERRVDKTQALDNRAGDWSRTMFLSSIDNLPTLKPNVDRSDDGKTCFVFLKSGFPCSATHRHR